ncbi:MAG: SIS domain-containing protein [Phenylobacterium sp.]|uniref:SIS domain-containing protein n=1 Tax=Phenylobacterium sp. TaxID=1871053 RepID=UPI0025E892E1|nr:SIS domain-containing protein [Phenylobacterium sp.]MCA3700398.1 SIS domain-containing protein [Brevundimonas sp.]MCA6298232.1 SIS domain-containing protein [Phenylobacterium sp.]
MTGGPEFFHGYAARLQETLAAADFAPVETLAEALLQAWRAGRSVYLCGNGGSAGNAIHLVNDLIYGAVQGRGPGVRAHALSANAAVLTCLANDTDYSEVFALQLKTFGQPGDILLALSGSGNSPNILKAIETGRALGMKTFAILGYSGGKARSLVDVPIHFPVDDMQISEDMQLIVGHMVMQWLMAETAKGL